MIPGSLRVPALRRPFPLRVKAILDSLPEVENFLSNLEKKEHNPIERREAKDAYSTASALLEVGRDRIAGRVR